MMVILVHIIFLLGLFEFLQEFINRNLLGKWFFIPIEFQSEVFGEVFYFPSTLVAFFEL